MSLAPELSYELAADSAPAASSVHYADRYRVYQNPLSKQWHVIQGFRYLRSGATWEEALTYAVQAAEKDRHGAKTWALLNEQRRQHIHGVG